MHTNTKHQEGFTLVELSIVLVIIGLIIGGILVGQDMIKAASIRSTISQISGYNSAMNTFRDKYQYLPGDVSASAATRYGFVTRAGTVGQGDGNGLIEGSGAGATIVSGETAIVWRDLNQAGLVNGSYTTATDAAVVAANPDAVKPYLPEAKIGGGNMITLYGAGGYNWFQVQGVTSIAAGAATTFDSISPQDASNMDTKMDDGMPLTGSTLATDNVNFNTIATAAAPASGVCVSNAAGNPYNTGTNTTASPWAVTPSCGLKIRTN